MCSFRLPALQVARRNAREVRQRQEERVTHIRRQAKALLLHRDNMSGRDLLRMVQSLTSPLRKNKRSQFGFVMEAYAIPMVQGRICS